MGRGASRKVLTVYQEYRNEAGYTLEKASDLMDNVVSVDRLGRIEGGRQVPTPEDVARMAECYKAPDLCNYYCANECAIGRKYVPEVEITALPDIILETIASLNDIQPCINRLIEISRDGRISDEEIPDFARIKMYLEQVSLAADTLTLWVEKTAACNQLNADLLEKVEAELKK